MSEAPNPDSYSSPDGSFTKVVISKGFGCFVPIDGSLCKIKVYSDEDSLVNDVDDDNIKEAVIGEADSDIEAVIHACVATMKEDEICEVVVHKKTLPSELEKDKVIDCPVVIDELKSLSDDEKEISKDSDCVKDENKAIDLTEECKDQNIIESDNKVEEEKLNDKELKSPVSDESVITHKLRLQLISFTRQPEIWEMSVTEKWRRANHHKECGMELFTRGENKWACRRFSVALKYLISAELDIPREELGKDMDIKGMKLNCYLNLAACHLKQRNFEYVVKNCSKALELDVYNTKALYRRGMAYTHLQDYDKAKEDLDRALEYDPGNSAVIKQQQVLKARVQKLNKYFANAMRKMFT